MKESELLTLANTLHNTRLSLKMGIVCAGMSTVDVFDYALVRHKLADIGCYTCSKCLLWCYVPAVTPKPDVDVCPKCEEANCA